MLNDNLKEIEKNLFACIDMAKDCVENQRLDEAELHLNAALRRCVELKNEITKRSETIE